MSLEENIRNQRKARGLTQRRLGEIIGLSEQAIRMYELGKREPSADVINRIGEALDVAPESLRGIEVNSARGALELLFALDEKYGLTPHGRHRLRANRLDGHVGKGISDRYRSLERKERYGKQSFKLP